VQFWGDWARALSHVAAPSDKDRMQAEKELRRTSDVVKAEGFVNSVLPLI
jgi:hypothetical protein